MKNLSNLLERFAKSLGRSTLELEIIQKSIEDVCRIILPKEDISLKEGVLTIRTSPAKQNTLCLKEEKFLNVLKERGVKVQRIVYS